MDITKMHVNAVYVLYHGYSLKMYKDGSPNM